MSLLHSILSIYLLLSTIQSLLPTHTCTHSIACVHAHTHSHIYTDTHKCTYRHIMVHLPQRRHLTYFFILAFLFFPFLWSSHSRFFFIQKKHLFQLPILKFSPSTFFQLWIGKRLPHEKQKMALDRKMSVWFWQPSTLLHLLKMIGTIWREKKIILPFSSDLQKQFAIEHWSARIFCSSHPFPCLETINVLPQLV